MDHGAGADERRAALVSPAGAHGDRSEVPGPGEEGFGEALFPQSLRFYTDIYRNRTVYMILFTYFLHKLW